MLRHTIQRIGICFLGFFVLSGILMSSVFAQETATINAGDTSWVLTSSALVLAMVIPHPRLWLWKKPPNPGLLLKDFFLSMQYWDQPWPLFDCSTKQGLLGCRILMIFFQPYLLPCSLGACLSPDRNSR